MRLFQWIKDNPLLVFTLFLLAFIPLYPKFPLFDLQHTWVYIRIEDLIIGLAWIVFFITYFKKKATLSTPLSYSILIFWVVGLVATINGIIFIFPKLANVYPQLAVLNYLRRIEYLSVFFLAYSAIKHKSAITPIIATLSATLFGVFAYGIGQRLLGFPAFLTMNEEFAKGIPLRLSALARIPSTFAGHYDLAAYLIILIPIMGSMVFGYKKWYLKCIFFLLASSGFILLLMTASRVSVAVYLVTVVLMLFLQRQKKYIIPVVILSILIMNLFTGITSRFAQTFTQVDLVVDSRTGKAIGVASSIGGDNITIEDKQSTGENLPTGSKFINFGGGGKEQSSTITYKKLRVGNDQAEIISKTGKVIVKKAFAYDVSFTTRFQGEWPNAIKAFQRNIFLGSGYSSISLATDNSFLRMLGETGLLGFFSFIFIFIFIGIYLVRIVPDIDDRRIKALIFGVLAGSVGLALNAILIDVYEASKVAFVLWLILGITMGLAHLYQKKSISYLAELKRIFLSVPSYLVTLVLAGFIFFGRFLSNYFVGDDFTWLRWAADCKQMLIQTGLKQCSDVLPTILNLFTHSEGFFYRPGTKLYFYLIYPIFELFPTPFHVISLLLHISASILVLFIIKKFLKSSMLGFVAAFLFLILSVHGEAIYWVSVTGHLIASNLILLALLSYIYWRETRRSFLFVVSALAVFISMFFHEFGTTGPLLLIAYDLVQDWRGAIRSPLKKWYYFLLLFPIVIYYLMRLSAQSVWFQGDYSYNLVKLPLNFIGNSVGYFLITLVGPFILESYTAFRAVAAQNLVVTGVIALVVIIVTGGVLVIKRNKISPQTGKIIILSTITFFIPLLPFLGLGNISPRYAYLGSFGVVLLITYGLYRFIHAQKYSRLSYGIVTVCCFVFIFLHVNQLYKINSDWEKAGEISNNALVGMNVAYAKPGALPTDPVFYFINVPIRYGDAWVFPVGFDDAVWFSFQDTELDVVQTLSEEDATMSAKTNSNVKVFKFEQDGGLVEIDIKIPTPALSPYVK